MGTARGAWLGLTPGRWRLTGGSSEYLPRSLSSLTSNSEAFAATLASRLRPTSWSSTSLRSSSASQRTSNGLPEFVEGVGVARVLVATGRLVRAVAVYGLLVADDSVELTGIEVDS